MLILTELKSIRTKKKYNFEINPMWQIILRNVIFIGLVWFFMLKIAAYRGIPIVLVLMVVLIGIYHFITSKTVSGRYIYALGGNAKAAKLSGIDTRKVFFWAYTIWTLSAVAGSFILETLRLLQKRETDSNLMQLLPCYMVVQLQQVEQVL